MADDTRFYRSTTEKKHYHIAYQGPSGITVSTVNGHTHPVEIDPATQAPYLAPVSGHAHGYKGPIGESTKKPKDDADDLTATVRELFKDAKSYESKFRTMGRESEAFVTGEGQWDDTDRNALRNAKRAALTINEISPKIDLLSGYQRQNRYDLKYLPMEEGDARVADLLTIVAKNVTEQNDYDMKESLACEDQMIVGRGLLNVYVDYDTNIKGDIKIEKFPWDEVYFGPHNEYDLSDCEYLIKTKWFSKAKLRQLWPDKADDVGKDYDTDEKESHQTVHGEQYTLGTGKPVGADPDFVDIGKKLYRVLDCERREYKKVPVLVNADDDFVLNAANWEAKDVEQVKTLPGFSVIERRNARIRQTIVSCDTLLEDKYPDRPTNDFNLIPIYAKKRGDNIQGKVEAAKDPQREVNKRHSQGADILNKVAAYGWFYDDNTFNGDRKLEEDFKKNASSPGFLQKVADTEKPPKQVEGVKFPTELANYETIASQKIKEIMNVNLEMEGNSSNAQSGIAILERKKQGLVGNEYLFDNLSFAKRQLGRKLIGYIQKIYTPERILRIIENENARKPVEVAGQPFPAGPDPEAQMQKQAILDLLRTSDLSKYDVVVAESGHSPTTRRANFVMWAELAGTRPEVPLQLLIELSDLPDKDKAMQAIQQQIQMQQQQEQAKQDTEIRKTEIATQAKMQKSEGTMNTP